MRLDFLIDGNNFDMAGEASSSVKRTLTKLGVAPPLVKRAAISMYEAEINAFIHGGGGSAHVEISDEKIEMVVEDSGEGIPDLDLACRKAGPRPANRCVEWDSVQAWDCLTSRKTAMFFLSKRRKDRGRKSP